MNTPTTALLLAALLGLSQCKKTESGPADPADQLPPATQTGANTFGCLLNGQPWLPTYGYLGSIPPLRVTYDPSYAGGSLQIRAYRIVSGLPDGQNMLIGGSSIVNPGSYAISSVGPAGISYSTGLQSGPCQEYYIFNKAPGFSMSGQLTITRLDLTNGVIAGTFSFTLAQTGATPSR